jgi:GH15 family glucan-1,4-alpha-glucosidase
MVISPGKSADLVLEISTIPFGDDVADVAQSWRRTEEVWRSDVPALENSLDPQGASLSVAVLHGLTSSSGAMVAAATTSLPERAEDGRNYDYRYAWIRDQALAAQAAAAAGVPQLLDAAVGFLTSRLLEDGPDLAPAYRTDGRRVPSQKRVKLPGYPGGFDRTGNHVNRQFQLDVFGESLLVFAAADRLGRLEGPSRSAARIAARAVASRWREADAGIWEIDNRAWTHSRLMCVAGLRHASNQRLGSTSEVSKWSALADEILAHVSSTSTHAGGYWQRSPDDPHVDASLLFAALRGAVSPDDTRSAFTLEAVVEQLCEYGYAYRFRHGESPLAKVEGSFVLCSFLVALNLHQQGRSAEALAWFERAAGCTGSSAIYGEEWDVRERQVRGNLPQAFVHALHLESSVTIK